MAKRAWPGWVLGLALCGVPAWGQTPAKKIQPPPLGDILPLLDAKSPQALAGVLRGAVLRFLPDPLYEAAPGWGHQHLAANQLKWGTDGSLFKPKIYKTLKNDGTWKKVRLNGLDLPDTLVL